MRRVLRARCGPIDNVYKVVLKFLSKLCLCIECLLVAVAELLPVPTRRSYSTSGWLLFKFWDTQACLLSLSHRFPPLSSFSTLASSAAFELF